MDNEAPNPLFEGFTPGQPTAPAASNGTAPAPAKKKRGGKKTVSAAPKKAKSASKRSTKPKKAAPVLRFGVTQIMAATAGLKEADRPLFESLLASLHGMGKPARERILAALGKIFT